MATAHGLRLRLFSADVPRDEAQAKEQDRSEEIALLRRAQAGDQDAFSEVVKRNWKRAFWTAYDVLYDHDRAQDVAQEAFVKVHKALQSYDLGRDFASWLYRIVLNLAIDHKRRLERDRTVPTDKVEEMIDARHTVAEDEDKAATIERVEQVLQDMPEEYRIPLTMKDIDGLSVEEVARILDLSYSTVRWRLHRARSLFRERWTRLLRREER
jgi:RNA polymerase sigma-70 factor (ECF subfamily)